MHAVRTSVCLTVSEGAELRCHMTGSNEASLQIGEADHELTFDYESFQDLVAQANKALGEMQAKAAEEQAEWEAEQARRDAAEQADRDDTP